MGKLSLSPYVAELAHKDPRLAQAFLSITDYVNNLATNTANTGEGEISPPPALAGVTVKASPNSELVHVSINHPGQIQKGIQYFTEIGTNDAAFSQPIVIDHGASRTSHPFQLPTNDDNGHPINYYFRSYAQYHGSKRSDFAYYGTALSPTAVTLNGSTNMTPLPSSGSGTAPNNGKHSGQGLGEFLTRPATPQAKRVIG